MFNVLDRPTTAANLCLSVPEWRHAKRAESCLICGDEARHSLPYEGPRRPLSRAPKMPALCCTHAAAYAALELAEAA